MSLCLECDHCHLIHKVMREVRGIPILMCRVCQSPQCPGVVDETNCLERHEMIVTRFTPAEVSYTRDSECFIETEEVLSYYAVPFVFIFNELNREFEANCADLTEVFSKIKQPQRIHFSPDRKGIYFTMRAPKWDILSIMQEIWGTSRTLRVIIRNSRSGKISNA